MQAITQDKSSQDRTKPVLALDGVTKIFPGVRALSEVSLNLFPGQVMALVGENGAGKSTVVKVLTGIYQPNKGDILLNGNPIHFSTPQSAANAGITAIHQETVLFDELSVAERYELRQEKSVPVLQDFKMWMLENYKSVLPKSTIGRALHYSLERFDKLMLYTSDGKLEIDNNLVENAIRPVAIGRKNYLFAGSHNGAKRAAMLYSFLGTCKINGVNPFEWLRATLEKIPTHPVNRLTELLPGKV